MMKIFLAMVPRFDDGSLLSLEDGTEFSEEEAAELVSELWNNMAGSFYSWNLEKIIFQDPIHDPSALAKMIEEIKNEMH